MSRSRTRSSLRTAGCLHRQRREALTAATRVVPDPRHFAAIGSLGSARAGRLDAVRFRKPARQAAAASSTGPIRSRGRGW